MLQVPAIRLATPHDARAIAELSRDAIEHGLRWRYTPDRILVAQRSRTTNVAVIHARGCLLAAGIMDYGDLSAHLVLLGVQRAHRRHGLGRRLLAWLEACAVTAGLRAIDLEVREDNPNALAFYRALGYDRVGNVRGYYDGVLDAVRLAKPLGQRGTKRRE
jgi:ribosomal protein S18 acetylase RimI-like enzyme